MINHNLQHVLTIRYMQTVHAITIALIKTLNNKKSKFSHYFPETAQSLRYYEYIIFR
jgi:hypothetical protein